MKIQVGGIFGEKYTRVNNNFPQDVVKSYQLLKDFKPFKPRHNMVPEANVFASAQDQKYTRQTIKKKVYGDNN